MEVLGALLVLLAVVSTLLVAARFVKFVLTLGLCALAFAGGGYLLLAFGSQDLLAQYPSLEDLLDSDLVEMSSGGAFVFGGGILLGLLARSAWRRFRRNGKGGASTRARV